jgi:hypothetical protein
METPQVTEQIRPLEPVGRDPFIDSTSVVPAQGWAAVSPIATQRFVTDDEPRRI